MRRNEAHCHCGRGACGLTAYVFIHIAGPAGVGRGAGRSGRAEAAVVFGVVVLRGLQCKTSWKRMGDVKSAGFGRWTVAGRGVLSPHARPLYQSLTDPPFASCGGAASLSLTGRLAPGSTERWAGAPIFRGWACHKLWGYVILNGPSPGPALTQVPGGMSSQTAVPPQSVAE